MNFKARGVLKANPTLAARVKLDPVKFETSVAGSMDCHVSALSGYVGDVRVRLAIPFLKPRRHLPLVGTIGGFRIRLKPFDIHCGTKGIHAIGTLGSEGVSGEVTARVDCEMECHVDGDLPVKIGRVHFDVDEASHPQGDSKGKGE